MLNIYIIKIKIIHFFCLFSFAVSEISSSNEANYNLFITSLHQFNQNFGLSKKEIDIMNIKKNNDQIIITMGCSRNNYKSTIATCSYFIGKILKEIDLFSFNSIVIELKIESFDNSKFVTDIELKTFIDIIEERVSMSKFVNNIKLIEYKEK